MSEKFFITTPIYYINSVPHVGHAYTQIAADARARFERLRGKDVYFLTGTDENALKVARVAEELGRDPLEFCDELAAAFRDVWDKLGISYDDFIRTTEERHRVPVQKVVQRLWDGGHLELGTYSGWYSVPDETFFREEDTFEQDGAHYISNPSEDQSKAPLEWTEEIGHFFKLSAFQDALLKYYAENPAMLRPESRRNETLRYIESGLRDTSISRVQEWGIPLPEGVPENQNRVVYVWFPDALLNYATAPGYLSENPEKARKFAELWPPDLQLMSKDIFTRFHATMWPALLQALDLELPRELFAHGFWTVNGRKISKRDPETIIEPIAFSEQIAALSGADFAVAVDALRYYCLREVTFGVDGDFSPQGCFVRYNSDLANGLGNLLQRTLVMIHKYCDGAVPASQNRDLGLKNDLPRLLSEVESDYQTLNFSGALNSIWEVIARANRLIEEEKPWVKVKEGRTEDIADLLIELLAACQFVAVVASPVMPTSSATIWKALGRDTAMNWSQSATLPFETGHLVAPAQPLFPRADLAKLSKETLQKAFKPQKMIPDSNLTPETSAPESQAPDAATPNATVETKPEAAPAPSYITIDDFMKVQLRTGKVIEAERVPKADKLLRLQVDLGSETRQILAGIAQHFGPDEMLGRTVVVVANLAPRTMRGYESQGMLLAASNDEGVLTLVTTDTEITPGSQVR
ncbi:methionyl-tRNA synthetase [Abditibacterium utsteinense]|uniref:Methionine--tRNA ligase n=1 Tax=Abditibacterium utsteinense TaxID=1960156 RepID=A0A2S8SXF3_9BACT|nr:methionine--tRNA ligase [Abditibacterium utsteinense]PQV65480.1 methionyl-tRNA synthetase [Abditibacterium utsteinense]